MRDLSSRDADFDSSNVWFRDIMTGKSFTLALSLSVYYPNAIGSAFF